MKLGSSFYYVGDLEKAKKMYSRFLEKTPVYADDDWARFELDGGSIALHFNPEVKETEEPTAVKYGAIVSFTVDDIPETVRRAKDAGFRQAGNVNEQPFGKLASMLDPWGNRISLLQPLGD